MKYSYQIKWEIIFDFPWNSWYSDLGHLSSIQFFWSSSCFVDQILNRYGWLSTPHISTMSPILIDNVTNLQHSWLLQLNPAGPTYKPSYFCNASNHDNLGKVVCIRKGIVNCCRDPCWSALFKVGHNYQTSWRYVQGTREVLSHSPRYELVPCWACLEHSTKLTFHLVNQILPLLKHKFYGRYCVGLATRNNGFKSGNKKHENFQK